jgi:hypothetical protein
VKETGIGRGYSDQLVKVLWYHRLHQPGLSTLKDLVVCQSRPFHKVLQPLLPPGDLPTPSIRYFQVTELSHDLAFASLSAQALVLKSEARSWTVSEM